MKIWPVKVRIPKKWGICEVREMTDRECIISRKKNIYLAARSHGFVNLFRDGVFIGWCGVAYAKRRLINKKATLPKYIREVPV